ncbi:tyrosine-type recombinase/integrase, partial [Klebsiella pneumoniae]
MSGLLSYSHPQQPAQMPVAIDYPAALALRQMALVQDELPKYLLAPEVSALLHYVPDLHRKMLLATLWNTGARINEALALTLEVISFCYMSFLILSGSFVTR